MRPDGKISQSWGERAKPYSRGASGCGDENWPPPPGSFTQGPHLSRSSHQRERECGHGPSPSPRSSRNLSLGTSPRTLIKCSSGRHGPWTLGRQSDRCDPGTGMEAGGAAWRWRPVSHHRPGFECREQLSAMTEVRLSCGWVAGRDALRRARRALWLGGRDGGLNSTASKPGVEDRESR